MNCLSTEPSKINIFNYCWKIADGEEYRAVFDDFDKFYIPTACQFMGRTSTGAIAGI
jgi:hypothetical protein